MSEIDIEVEVDLTLITDAVEVTVDDEENIVVEVAGEGLLTGYVSSFNSRSGAVTPASGDYTASQITNVPAGTIAATTVQAALDELDTEKLAVTAARTKLTGNTTYNVPATYSTIQAAIDHVASNIDAGGFTVTIQVASGTYNERVVLKNIVGFGGAGTLVLRGDPTTPGNVIISNSGANQDCIQANGLYVTWDVKGFKLVSSGTGASMGLHLMNGTALRMGVMDFGACTLAHICAESDASMSRIGGEANYNISGNSVFHVLCQLKSNIESINGTITFSGGKKTFTAFCLLQLGASVYRVSNNNFGTAITADAGTDLITWTGHGLSNNDPLQIVTDSGGATPGGLATATTYFVRDVTTDTFKLETSIGAGAINITSNGSGNRAFSVVGARYLISDVTCIILAAAGASYLPGNSPGSGANYV